MKVNDVRKHINLSEFPSIYQEFLQGVEGGTEINTLELERKGRLLKNTDDDKDVIDFIQLVFKWGGKTGNRIRGMLYKYQKKNQIAKIIKESSYFLEKHDLESAITKVISLKGLRISYGSKILRMLSPQQAGVYDSLLAECLCYKDSPCGYVEFCSDCQKLSDELQRKSIKNPRRKNGVWYVADVEAVIYSRCGDFS